ncbi:molybdopterin-guanine dinucleotide biosynthesis protein B [Lederbergia citri]|uniref:Molybdopterin-guanine dinucleotide biosynthesis protein B n=1 Tax=Lederbergia citri TaxID=2833580 RepID=A0A942TCQ7_9BACI|nr:molybdopterin-guanine dinucleotide biosynthesis protein B [Lederbergia citri]MBS4194386.1 molybdopterin-guanine dinucleotide biosynthesis protein B [Lederbergia citri]
MGGSKVFQIVGFQNSGKTTLIEKLIKAGNEKGLRIGTIKHHGHGGPIDLPNLNKDSNRHSRAGSIVSSVAGEGTLLIEAPKDDWGLEDIIQVYHRFELDLILVEGYKKSPYPKAVMIRNKEDLSLLNRLKNIQTVISWFPIETNYPVFLHTQVDDFIVFFYKDLFSNFGGNNR